MIKVLKKELKELQEVLLMYVIGNKTFSIVYKLALKFWNLWESYCRIREINCCLVFHLLTKMCCFHDSFFFCEFIVPEHFRQNREHFEQFFPAHPRFFRQLWSNILSLYHWSWGTKLFCWNKYLQLQKRKHWKCEKNLKMWIFTNLTIFFDELDLSLERRK